MFIVVGAVPEGDRHPARRSLSPELVWAWAWASGSRLTAVSSKPFKNLFDKKTPCYKSEERRPTRYETPDGAGSSGGQSESRP